jgi:hypothetical protein
MYRRVDSASENEYQENSWGWRRPVRKGDDLTTFIVPKLIKNPETLTYRIPKRLFRPVAGKRNLFCFTWVSTLVSHTNTKAAGGWDSVVGKDWMVRGLKPGEGEIFRPRGPSSLLYNQYRISVPELNGSGRGADHPLPPHPLLAPGSRMGRAILLCIFGM